MDISTSTIPFVRLMTEITKGELTRDLMKSFINCDTVSVNIEVGSRKALAACMLFGDFVHLWTWSLNSDATLTGPWTSLQDWSELLLLQTILSVPFEGQHMDY